MSLDSKKFVRSDRRDFNSERQLNESSLPENPWTLFKDWLEEAISDEIDDVYAMHVSSVSSDGKPHNRVVYMRDFSEEGIIFYTNYDSDKAKEFSTNNKVCLTFLWLKHDRQLRMEGSISKIPAEKSDEYFSKRPRKSQIGAWASNQSQKLNSREELEKKLAQMEEKFKGQNVPRPSHWGGYMVDINRFEFWQGRPSRLHDRIVFEQEENTYISYRLNP
jgi:pyridoxamine 5'-phosphate oxidase